MKFQHDCRNKSKNLSDRLVVNHAWILDTQRCALQIYEFMNTGCQWSFSEYS